MLGFLFNFGDNLVDEYNVPRQRLLWLANALLIASVIGVVANYVGTTWDIVWLRQLNLVVGCLFVIFSGYVMTCPAVIVGLLGFGYARHIPPNVPGAVMGAIWTARDLGRVIAWYSIWRETLRSTDPSTR